MLNTGPDPGSRHDTRLLDRGPVELRLGTIVERYRLVRGIGHGANATVYLAREVGTGVLRVIKFYRPDSDPTRRKVRHLARTFERLHGTDVATRYHHMGVWRPPRQGAILYLVVDYLAGTSLSDFLDGTHDEDGTLAMDVIWRLASKLSRAHALWYRAREFPAWS